jgi:NADPH-dependent curcumin reductase
VFDAVLPLLNIGARVPVCGVIAHYNDETLPPGPNRLPLLMGQAVQKRIRLQGFIILDHYVERFDAFRRDMGEWVANGRVRLREAWSRGWRTRRRRSSACSRGAT